MLTITTGTIIHNAKNLYIFIYSKVSHVIAYIRGAGIEQKKREMLKDKQITQEICMFAHFCDRRSHHFCHPCPCFTLSLLAGERFSFAKWQQKQQEKIRDFICKTAADYI